ncbi:3-isopropylmalate dehydratase small subunit [compost metagenome]
MDLAAQQVVTPAGNVITFTLDPFKQHCLLNGLDDIALALRHAAQIHDYEQVRRQREPWLFN